MQLFLSIALGLSGLITLCLTFFWHRNAQAQYDMIKSLLAENRGVREDFARLEHDFNELLAILDRRIREAAEYRKRLKKTEKELERAHKNLEMVLQEQIQKPVEIVVEDTKQLSLFDINKGERYEREGNTYA